MSREVDTYYKFWRLDSQLIVEIVCRPRSHDNERSSLALGCVLGRSRLWDTLKGVN